MAVNVGKKLVAFLLVALTTVGFANAGKVYVYRNADGVLVFSDAPQSGKAEEIKLTTKPTVIPSEDTTVFDNSQIVQTDKIKYSISINQPANEATVRDNTGSVYVSGTVSPNFQQGHFVRLLLDGQQYGQKLGRTTQILRNIDRGEHTVQMELLDKTGKVIASSELVTFYLHRNAVSRPPARAQGGG